MSSIPVKHPDEITQELDREQAFLLYAAFCGDVERTAHALGVSAVDVLRIADDEKWNDKLKGIIELKKSARPGDVERAVNRALNFVQAHRMRLFVERIIHKLTGLNPDELHEYLFQKDAMSVGRNKKDPGQPIIVKLSTRAVADLASAMEKAQAMSYLALNDTAQERIKRKEAIEGNEAGGELHAKIADAMSKLGKSRTPRALLFDAQLDEANKGRAKAVVEKRKPYNPLDDDDH